MDSKRITSSPFEISAECGVVREILTLGDGYATGVFVHSPQVRGGAKFPVLYLHGIQSHPGWFFGSAMRMAECGGEVYQVTRRGSGDNVVSKGHARSVKQLMDDVATAIDFACSRSETEKVHLMGVSWGGKLAAGYALQRQDERVASLTCIAPGIFAKVDVPLRMKLAIGKALLMQPRKAFPIPLNEPELFTDNPAMRKFLRDDPLRLHEATARFLYVSRMLDRQLQHGRKIGVATKLILSSDDKIIDNAPTRKFFEQTCDDLQITELPGAHTQEFEQNPEPLYKILTQIVGSAIADHRQRRR